MLIRRKVQTALAAVLLSADGEPIGMWQGNFPEDEVLDRARS